MTYYVFRRNDGYVGAIQTSELVKEGGKPSRLRDFTNALGSVTFEVILRSEDWAECVRLVATENGGGVDAVIEAIAELGNAPTVVETGDEIKRRMVDNIATQLTSIRERLRHAHLDVVEHHGTGHPVQSTLEIALIALNDAIRFNKKGEF